MKYSIIIILFLSCLNASGNENPVVRYDKSNIVVRQPEEKVIQQYQNSKDFKYDDNEINILDYYFKRLLYKLARVLGFVNVNVQMIKYILYVIFGAFLIYVLFRLFNVKVTSLFRNNSNKHYIHYEELSENINEINIDEIINDSINKGDFRKAVRYLYLKSLRQLSNVGLIYWKIDKTNRDYLYEISDATNRLHFAELSRLYEYVWYGEFNLQKRDFDKASNSFNNFIDRINATN